MLIGIDPGSKGSLAMFSIHQRKPVLIEVLAFEHNPNWATVTWEWLKKSEIGRTWLEHVHSMPAQGVTSTFTFGENTGRVKNLLELALHEKLLAKPHELVAPMYWQARCGLKGPYCPEGSRAQRKAARKKAHKEYALKHYPQIENMKGDIFDGVCIGHANTVDYILERDY